MGRKTLLISVAVSAAIVFAGLLTAFLLLDGRESGDEVRVYSSYANDPQMWQHIFDYDGEYDFSSLPAGAILPHHIIDAKELNKFYKGLAAAYEGKKNNKPDLFIIFGPNHYQAGEANVQTCFDCVYETFNGDLEVDREAAVALVASGAADRRDATFENEHAIHSHSQFIKKYFPEAKILPIVFQWKMPVAELKPVAKWILGNIVDKSSFSIASVDFSHYVSAEMADFHDESSWASIANFDFENIYDLEIDSPSSVYTLMGLVHDSGYNSAQRLAHTNTQDLTPEKIARTTSHQFITFSKGNVAQQNVVTALVFNDDFGNSALGIFNSWDWWPDGVRVGPLPFPELNAIRGEEDRFLMGADYIVFKLKDGECEVGTQNGLEISFCWNEAGGINVSVGTEKLTVKDASREHPVQILYKNAVLTHKKL